MFRILLCSKCLKSGCLKSEIVWNWNFCEISFQTHKVSSRLQSFYESVWNPKSLYFRHIFGQNLSENQIVGKPKSMLDFTHTYVCTVEHMYLKRATWLVFECPDFGHVVYMEDFCFANDNYYAFRSKSLLQQCKWELWCIKVMYIRRRKRCRGRGVACP